MSRISDGMERNVVLVSWTASQSGPTTFGKWMHDGVSRLIAEQWCGWFWSHSQGIAPSGRLRRSLMNMRTFDGAWMKLWSDFDGGLSASASCTNVNGQT